MVNRFQFFSIVSNSIKKKFFCSLPIINKLTIIFPIIGDQLVARSLIFQSLHRRFFFCLLFYGYFFFLHSLPLSITFLINVSQTLFLWFFYALNVNVLFGWIIGCYKAPILWNFCNNLLFFLLCVCVCCKLASEWVFRSWMNA